MLFTSHNTPHITLGNEQCLKLLLGVCNTRKRGDLSISLSSTKKRIRFLAVEKMFLIEEEGGVECLAGGGGTKLTIVPGLTSQFLGSPPSRMFLNKRN
jgi:hypothetical protein